MTDSIEQRVREVIADQMGVADEDTISRDTNVVTDLGADSLDAVEIVMALEEEFNIEIELDANLAKFETVGGCIDYISKVLK